MTTRNLIGEIPYEHSILLIYNFSWIGGIVYGETVVCVYIRMYIHTCMHTHMYMYTVYTVLMYYVRMYVRTYEHALINTVHAYMYMYYIVYESLCVCAHVHILYICSV